MSPWNFYNSSGELQINDGGVLASAAVFTGKVDLGSNLLVGNAGSTGIAISANGEVVMAAQPGFLAHSAADQNNSTGDGTLVTIVYGTEIFDQNSDFDGVSTFTAPVTGRYLLRVTAQLLQLASGHVQNVFNIVTSNRSYIQAVNPYAVFDATATFTNCELVEIVDMDAGNTAYFTVDVAGGAKSVDIGSGLSTRFSGWLLG